VQKIIVSNLRIIVTLLCLHVTTRIDFVFLYEIVDENGTTLLVLSMTMCVPRNQSDFRRGACFDRRFGGSRSLGIGINS
jgi:hypothetical protein